MCKLIGTVSLVGVVLMASSLPGCFRGPCGRGSRARSVTGTALDAESMQPLSDAVIRMTSVTTGDTNGFGFGSTAFSGSQPPTPEDGAFEVTLRSHGRSVCGGLFPILPPEFALPDEIQVTVILDGCEQELTIAVNDNTATQVIEDGEVTEIQLLAPILVPPCPPPTDETAEPESTEPTE